MDKQYTIGVQVQGTEQVEQLNQELEQTATATKAVGDASQQTAEAVNSSMKQVAEDAGEGFTRLQTKLRQTQTALQAALDVGDAKEVKRLRAELGDLEDSLDVAKIKSQQFDDVLAGLPGPAGAAGSAIKGVDGAFKLLAANPIIAAIGVLVGAFLALKESLSRTEEGQKKLSQISESFSKILNGLFAVIEPIAFALADLVSGLLSSETTMNVLSGTVGTLSGVFTGLLGTLKSVGIFIYDVLVTNFQTLINVAKGASDVIAGVFTFDWDRVTKGADAAFNAVSDGVKNQVDNAKKLGNGVATAVSDGFKAGAKAFEEGTKRLTEAEKEAKKKAEERAKQRVEIEKKANEELIKTTQELAIAQAKTAKDTLDQELKNKQDSLKRKYDADIAAAKKVGADTTDITKAYENQKLLNQAEYNKKAEQLNQDLLNNLKQQAENQVKDAEAVSEQLLDSQNELNNKLLQNQINAVADKNQKIALENQLALQQEQQNNQKAIDSIKDTERDKLEAATKTYQDLIKQAQDAGQSTTDITANFEAEKLRIATDAQNQLTVQAQTTSANIVAIDETTKAKQKELEAELLETKKAAQAASVDLAAQAFDVIGQLAEAFAGDTEEEQRKAFKINKAASLASAIVQTYQSATAAYASQLSIPTPDAPIRASIAAGIAIAAGLANVAKISKTEFESKTVDGSKPSGGSVPSPSAPPIPTSQGTFTPTTGFTPPQTQTGGEQQKLSEKEKIMPQKVYVLSGDVTTAQEADAKINQRRKL